MAMLVRFSKSCPRNIIPNILSRVGSRFWWKQQSGFQLLRYMSALQQQDKKPQLHTVSDVMTLIEKKRLHINKTHPLFPALRDNSIPKEQRLSFAPYLLFFTLGYADALTLCMRFDKPDHELTDIERSVNKYVKEDSFHYNYFLRDLKTLGYTLDKFGSVEGLVRCTWATEAIPVRRLIYTIITTVGRSKDPLVCLCMFEMLEAGLQGFFTTIYNEIVTAKDGLTELEYFGDPHVELEINHTVTAWFSEKEKPSGPDRPLTPEAAEVINDLIEEFTGRFEAMYTSFHEIIKQGGSFISPKKFDVKGTPPVDKITQDWKEVVTPEDLLDYTKLTQDPIPSHPIPA